MHMRNDSFSSVYTIEYMKACASMHTSTIQATQLWKKNNRGKRKEQTTTKEVSWSTAKIHVAPLRSCFSTQHTNIHFKNKNQEYT